MYLNENNNSDHVLKIIQFNTYKIHTLHEISLDQID